MGRALIHFQGAAVHGAANPSAGLGHVKPGEGAQVKGAGGLFNIDGDLVAACFQCRNNRLAHIQAGQPILAAIQLLQCRILAQIQTGQLVFVASQVPQRRIVAHIQFRQLVPAAI